VYFPTTEQTVAVDANGRFEVDLPEGVNWAQVSAPGHRSESFREQLRVNETLDVIYGLEPLVVNPYETIVRGDRERTEVSRVTLRDQELREVPGTQGDPFRVVMLLPGVSSVASGVSYPIVRGTQPAATGYFIDGIRVPLLFHLFLGPAVVHPDFIEAIDFFPGAPPPRYGRLMGGAIEGHISRPREDRVHATLYADLMNAGVFVEAPIKETGTSFTAAGRISYTPWLIAIIANTQPGLDRNSRLVLDFYDYQARIEQKVGPGSLRLFAFGSSDVVGTAANNEQGFTALQSVVFHRVDLRYRQPVGEGEVEAGVTLGLDRLRFEATGGRQTGILFSLDDKSLKARAGYTLRLLPELRLETGADLDRREADVRVSFTVPQNPQDPNSPINTVDLSIPVAVGTLIGGWVQAVYTGIPKLTLIPGLRLDSYHLVPRIDNFVAEPRLTARYALTDGVTLKAAGGVFHQAPVTLINLPAVDMGSLRFGVQRGVQTDIGVEWKVREGLEVNADVYFNPILRSLELSPFEQLQGQLPQPGQDPGEVADAIIRRQITTGYAYGFELLVRHPLGGNWFGWLSYSLQRSVRRKEIVRRDEFGDEIGRDTVDLPFTYDQTHVLNAVLSYKFEGGWTVGGVVHFNTGRPETGVLTSLTQRQGVSRFGDPAWIPVDQDKADRLPAFFRVDARVAKTWAFDLFTLEAYLDVLNLGLSQEVISFNYSGGGAGPEGEPTPLEKQPVAIPIFLPVLGLKASY
jgi:hypothetical protein